MTTSPLKRPAGTAEISTISCFPAFSPSCHLSRTKIVAFFGYWKRLTTEMSSVAAPPARATRPATAPPPWRHARDWDDYRHQAALRILALNPDGTYTYSGRSDDMLKVSGIYVSPFEVEATLVQHPAVLEAAVIGVPDAEGLTKTKAFVVLKPGQDVSDAELKVFVKDKLAPYKYPRAIEFRDRLPRTETGKLQRFKLRQGAGASPSPSPTKTTT